MKKIPFILCYAVAAFFFASESHAQIINTFAGNGTAASSGDGGPATAASFFNPGGAFYDSHGNVFVTEYTGNKIRKINPSHVVSAFAGNGSAGYGGDGGPATAASFNYLIDIISDFSGNMYVIDNGNHRIRKIDTFGIVTTYAGTGSSGFSGDGGPATAADISFPSRFGIDAGGNLYFADAGNHRIRKISTSGIITTVAGNGSATFSGDGGQATAASLSNPLGVTFDANGNMYIADASNHRIRKVRPSGIISTYAGNGTASTSGDGGPATAATLNFPSGVACDHACNVYFTDWTDQVIRKINVAGTISNVGGTGTAGFSGDGGLATAAKIDGPNNLTFDPAGNLYVPDFYNNRIRTVIGLGQPTGCPPMVPIGSFISSSSFICQDSCLTFTNTSVGSIDSLRWTTVPAGAAISSPTSNTTSICFPNSGAYVVKLKVYGYGSSDSASSNIMVSATPHPHITRSGSTLTVGSGGYTSYQWFNGTSIAGATNSSYTYSGTSSAGYWVVVDSNGCRGTSNIINPVEVIDLNGATNHFWINSINSSITINASHSLEAVLNVSIFDLTGRCVFHDNWNAGTVTKEISNFALAHGVYIIKLNNNNTSVAVKWVCE